VATLEVCMKRKANVLPVATFVFLLALVTVAGCQRADVEQAAGDETEPDGVSETTNGAETDATYSEERDADARAGDGGAVAEVDGARAGNGKARAGDAVAGNGQARVGNVVAGDGEDEVRAGDVVVENSGDSGGGLPGKVILKIDGEPGALFSGTCTVGGEEREVSGQVPGRFVYEPEGREVECEIQNRGPDAGPLEFSVTADGSNRKQKVKVTGDTMSFSFSGNSISHTTSSTSSAAVQESSVSNSSYSRSSVSSSSGR
jgi:hypothetical protein